MGLKTDNLINLSMIADVHFRLGYLAKGAILYFLSAHVGASRARSMSQQDVFPNQMNTVDTQDQDTFLSNAINSRWEQLMW